jgi:hypothetical protein
MDYLQAKWAVPHGPSADWQVLTTANTAGKNGLTCLPKHIYLIVILDKLIKHFESMLSNMHWWQ